MARFSFSHPDKQPGFALPLGGVLRGLEQRAGCRAERPKGLEDRLVVYRQAGWAAAAAAAAAVAAVKSAVARHFLDVLLTDVRALGL